MQHSSTTIHCMLCIISNNPQSVGNISVIQPTDKTFRTLSPRGVDKSMQFSFSYLDISVLWTIKTLLLRVSQKNSKNNKTNHLSLIHVFQSLCDLQCVLQPPHFLYCLSCLTLCLLPAIKDSIYITDWIYLRLKD